MAKPKRVKRVLNVVPSREAERDWGQHADRAGLLAAACRDPHVERPSHAGGSRRPGLERFVRRLGHRRLGAALALRHDQRIAERDKLSVRFVWMAAKETDEFNSRPTTFIEPEGTSLKAALDVARKYGAVRDTDLPFARPKLFAGDAKAFYLLASQLKIAAYVNLGRDRGLAALARHRGPDPHPAHCDDTWMNAKSTKGELAPTTRPARRRPRGRARGLHAGPLHRAQQLGLRPGATRASPTRPTPTPPTPSPRPTAWPVRAPEAEGGAHAGGSGPVRSHLAPRRARAPGCPRTTNRARERRSSRARRTGHQPKRSRSLQLEHHARARRGRVGAPVTRRASAHPGPAPRRAASSAPSVTSTRSSGSTRPRDRPVGRPLRGHHVGVQRPGLAWPSWPSPSGGPATATGRSPRRCRPRSSPHRLPPARGPGRRPTFRGAPPPRPAQKQRVDAHLAPSSRRGWCRRSRTLPAAGNGWLVASRGAIRPELKPSVSNFTLCVFWLLFRQIDRVAGEHVHARRGRTRRSRRDEDGDAWAGAAAAGPRARPHRATR